MSYCRFQNTASDLAECRDALQEMVERADAPGNGEESVALSAREEKAAKRVVALCAEIVQMMADEIGEDVDLDVDDLETAVVELQARVVARDEEAGS